MPSSLLGKSVPIDGGGGVCAVSRSRARPQDTRRQRHRKFMTSPSNPTKFVLKVRQFVGWFVELHLLSPLSQWTKRGEILGGYSDCPTSKLQIQILVRVECCGVCSAATLPSFSYLELSGRPTTTTAGQRLEYRWLAPTIPSPTSVVIDNGGRCRKFCSEEFSCARREELTYVP